MPRHLRGQLPIVACGLVGFMDKGATVVLGGNLPMPHQMCGRLHVIGLQLDMLLPYCRVVTNHRQNVQGGQHHVVLPTVKMSLHYFIGW